MSRRIAHRGPDDEGFYIRQNIGLGAKRLAIIDIGGGHQPMLSEDQTVVVIFNGEIYNYLPLKQDLEKKGHQFRSRCDTEVLVHLYEEFGTKMVDHLNGMFAFAIYDQKKDQLLLARDRLGIKPIYYFFSNDWFLFSSEIKAFLGFPEFSPELDLEAVHHYLTFRFAPSPMTLFKGVSKLPPGFLLEYFPRQSGDPRLTRYWDLTFDRGEKEFSEAESTDAVRSLLDDAVKIRLMSEVPLGVMLSGGVDSGVVVSSMKKSTQQPVSTFTVSYEEEGPHNEGVLAKSTADAFQTDHHEIVMRLDDFVEHLERMVYFMDEPIADPAAIPIFDLCRFSKKYVTVLLSGMGGDELFAGYKVYKEALLLNYLGHVPRLAWNSIVLPLYGLIPASVPGKNFVHRVHRPVEDVFLGSSFVYGGFTEQQKVNLYTNDFAEQQSAFNSHSVIQQTLRKLTSASKLHKMMYVDTKHWLADSHLIMLDKMSMANSIEARTPILDHRLVELVASVPESFKINLFRSKILFKNAFSSEIPRPILKRSKRGFSTPLNLWLHWYGYELIETYLNQSNLTKSMFKKSAIDELLVLHKQNRGDFSASIFTLLVLGMWLTTFLDNS
jgi:asparagine synthase (glutamine-hydrolysing)